MAEEKKVAMRTVYNQSPRRFKLPAPVGKHAWLEPGEAKEVPAEFAEILLKYPGVIDPSKLVKGNKTDKETIESLLKRAEDAEAKLKALAIESEKEDVKEAPKPQTKKEKGK